MKRFCFLLSVSLVLMASTAFLSSCGSDEPDSPQQASNPYPNEAQLIGSDYVFNKIHFRVNGQNATVIGMDDASGPIDLVIPETISFLDTRQNRYIQCAVTEIANDAFSEEESIKTVRFSQGLTTIGTRAFYRCWNFSGKLEIPNSVTSIGAEAFSGCSSLTSVNTGNSLTQIADYTFSECLLLESITIGKSITKISHFAFYGSNRIKELNWNAMNCQHDFRLSYDSFSLEKVNIGNDVKMIPDNFINGQNKVISVAFGSSVMKIGQNAFADCDGLKSITLPNSLIKIGPAAFRFCSSLTSITIPDNVTEIDANAFADSGLKSLVLGNSVATIGASAFENCNGLSQSSLVIPNSVTTIESSAFYNTDLGKVVVGTGLEAIDSNAFRNYEYNYDYKGTTVFIFKRPEPPHYFGYTPFSKKSTIYVPDSSVEKYKSKLSEYASIIKPVSEYSGSY